MQTSKNILTLAFLILATAVYAEDAADTLKQAHRAYLQGNATLAREKFIRVLELEPGNQSAAKYLKVVEAEIARGKAGQPPPSVAQARVKKVTFPVIDLREATLAEALEFIRQKCGQILGPDQPVNMVLLLSDEAKARKVTLNLKNVPATEVFRYVGQLGNVEFSYDQFSVIVKDANAARPPAPKPGAALNAAQQSFADVRVPKVDFREATLAESLDYLSQKTRQFSDGKLTPNFVLQMDDSAKAAKFTLALQDVPLTEVLRYIGELANVRFSYEQFAVVVKPRKEAAPAQAATATDTGVPKIPGLN